MRIQEAAPPGGISISHSVRWQLAKDLAAMFQRTESVLLKGNDDPIEISIWTPPEDGSPNSTRKRAGQRKLLNGRVSSPKNNGVRPSVIKSHLTALISTVG